MKLISGSLRYFAIAILLNESTSRLVNGADQNSLVDVKSDVEAFEEDLIVDPGTKRGQEIKRNPQNVRGAEECCPDIYNSLEDVKSQIEDLRAKLGEQFEWSSSHAVNCPYGFTYLPAARSCYKVVFESHTWTSAVQKCNELRWGSHLATITSATENNALKAFLAAEISKNVGNTACITSDALHYGSLFWTSGQRLIENSCASPFVWKPSSDKKLLFEFTDWDPGQPNCYTNSQFCVHIWPKNDFRWTDIWCSSKICPLCEYKP